MREDLASQQFGQLLDWLVLETPTLSSAVQFELSGDTRVPFGSELLVGSIGFGGRNIHGSLTLAASHSVWERLAPMELHEHMRGGTIEMAMLCDMVGELCNVLLGKFRNVLLRRGVEVSCATPTAVWGRLSEELPALRSRQSKWQSLHSEAGDIYLRLEASFDDDFTIPGPEAIEPNIDELVLF